jgi:hypothetical protein
VTREKGNNKIDMVLKALPNHDVKREFGKNKRTTIPTHETAPNLGKKALQVKGHYKKENKGVLSFKGQTSRF